MQELSHCLLCKFFFLNFFLRDFIFKKTLFEKKKLQYLKQEQKIAV